MNFNALMSLLRIMMMTMTVLIITEHISQSKRQYKNTGKKINKCTNWQTSEQAD